MCSCDLIDWGASDFETRSYPRSRRVRRCYECRGEIAKGQRYVRVAGKWDGAMYGYALCLDCERWGTAFHIAQRAACGCSGWVAGEMWAAIREFRNEHLEAA